MEDFNESIEVNRIEEFLIENRLFDIYRQYNEADKTKRESTYEYRKKFIDLPTTMAGLIEFIDRCKVVDFYEVINTDHRGYIINLNI